MFTYILCFFRFDLIPYLIGPTFWRTFNTWIQSLMCKWTFQYKIGIYINETFNLWLRAYSMQLRYRGLRYGMAILEPLMFLLHVKTRFSHWSKVEHSKFKSVHSGLGKKCGHTFQSSTSKNKLCDALLNILLKFVGRNLKFAKPYNVFSVIEASVLR